MISALKKLINRINFKKKPKDKYFDKEVKIYKEYFDEAKRENLVEPTNFNSLENNITTIYEGTIKNNRDYIKEKNWLKYELNTYLYDKRDISEMYYILVISSFCALCPAVYKTDSAITGFCIFILFSTFALHIKKSKEQFNEGRYISFYYLCLEILDDVKDNAKKEINIEECFGEVAATKDLEDDTLNQILKNTEDIKTFLGIKESK